MLLFLTFTQLKQWTAFNILMRYIFLVSQNGGQEHLPFFDSMQWNCWWCFKLILKAARTGRQASSEHCDLFWDIILKMADFNIVHHLSFYSPFTFIRCRAVIMTESGIMPAALFQGIMEGFHEDNFILVFGVKRSYYKVIVLLLSSFRTSGNFFSTIFTKSDQIPLLFSISIQLWGSCSIFWVQEYVLD